MKTEYNKFIEKYEALGHLEVLDDVFDIDSIKYFLPHHPLIRLENTTTKFRAPTY